VTRRSLNKPDHEARLAGAMALPAAAGGAGTEVQEGVMAKHLASSYLPGKRVACWRKIKPRRLLPVVIIGWIPCREGVGSLLVAALREGVLRYVANVRTGFSSQQRSDLPRSLESRRRSRPIVSCPHRGL